LGQHFGEDDKACYYIVRRHNHWSVWTALNSSITILCVGTIIGPFGPR